jgi:phage tail sheath protein FI
MPAALTFPGVYIEEIPSGVRTITGVATSITAFIGRARRGPVNEPIFITSFSDFERQFGGLQEEYLMSYAVRDFYVNGGSQAIIVRLVNPNFGTDHARDTYLKVFLAAEEVAKAARDATDLAAAKTAADDANKKIQASGTEEEKAAAQKVFNAVSGLPDGSGKDAIKAAANGARPDKPATSAKLRLPTDVNDPAKDPLILEAADPGDWGNNLRARVDYDHLEEVDKRFPPLTKDDLFNLSIRNVATGATEQFLAVTVRLDSPRRLDSLLENSSNLVRVQSKLSTARRSAESDSVMDAAIEKQIDNDDTIPPDKKPAAKEKAKKDARKAVPLSLDDTQRSVGVVADSNDEGFDGGTVDQNDITEGEGLQENKRGLFALEKADLFNLLCIPPDVRTEEETSDIETGRIVVYQSALKYCVPRRAFLIVDSPHSWSANPDKAVTTAKQGLTNLNLTGEEARNAAVFFPRVIQSDPRRDGQLDTFAPSGSIAGIIARTDASRGVWKAPAGLDAALNGIQALEVNLTDDENGVLNPLGINCLRFFPVAGRVVWGARTLRGADLQADEYKYIPVRRTALFIEESLYRGTQWVVFEPNDEPLWAQIRLNIGAFMQNLFRQGAFQGKTPREAYFVKCDGETTTQADINLGIVNIVVGFAPLKPAEFVVIKIQQMAGQIET